MGVSRLVRRHRHHHDHDGDGDNDNNNVVVDGKDAHVHIERELPASPVMRRHHHDHDHDDNNVVVKGNDAHVYVQRGLPKSNGDSLLVKEGHSRVYGQHHHHYQHDKKEHVVILDSIPDVVVAYAHPPNKVRALHERCTQETPFSMRSCSTAKRDDTSSTPGVPGVVNIVVSNSFTSYSVS